MSSFNLFVYGSLRSGQSANGILASCEKLGDALARGTLYDIDGRFTALVLYGSDVIRGEVWRCPTELLGELDEYESIGTGLFRRVGAEVEDAGGGLVPCWVYVAGPALSRRLTPERRASRHAHWRSAPTGPP